MSNNPNRTVEVLIGGIVVSIAIAFLVYSIIITGFTKQITGDGFTLHADFQSADGLRIGSDVVLAGVKVGKISEIKLDTEFFQAKTTFLLFKNYNLPEDTEAIVSSDGLLGGKYISLNVGGSDILLSSGDDLLYTQSSINILNLLSKFSSK